MVERIRLIWLDIFVERVNREEVSHSDRTNRHNIEQMNCKKRTELLVSSLLIKKSMVPFCHTVNLLPPVSTIRTWYGMAEDFSKPVIFFHSISTRKSSIPY